jgi:hypothetical protein
MARIRVDLDHETFEQLRRSALAELRTPDAQAAVILRRSLGLPMPIPATIDVIPEPAYREALTLRGATP